MKTSFFFFFLVLLMASCQLKKSDNSVKMLAEDSMNDSIESSMADTVKATAIFWIDKAENKHCKEYGFRMIKARVFIHEDGKVDLLSFIKEQSSGVETYIRHHLDKFHVSDKMFEGGYLQPGEQVVQLRCLWGMLKGK